MTADELQAMDVEARYDRTIGEAYERTNPLKCWDYKHRPRQAPFELSAHHLCLGYFAQRTARFAVGDVGLLWISNDQGERGEVFAWSTKVRNWINGLYVQHQRWDSKRAFRKRGSLAPNPTAHVNRSPFRIVEIEALRGELGRQPWTDPAVRRLAVAAIRASQAGCAVGTITGAATSAP